ncbi:hypothetical protein PYW07_005162 [Mythimna separata]|uniref:Enoyl-[acyl-carrier-protein] reductase, mitochondrial n=1 Tax=Mythimna separata TaxID=271217 RepID=A0AAD7YE07_MYTSE|nr:hypothetical protein PYW07_005162 [Mythimna separata]
MVVSFHRNKLFTAAKWFTKNSVKLTGSVRNLTSKQLVYSEFGDPLQVLKVKETQVPKLGTQDVLVRMLAAPINPADINTIQGKYPVKLTLPSIAGNEGVGIVEEIGEEVSDIRPGNKVIVTRPVQGKAVSLPRLPAIPGDEGVGDIVEIGKHKSSATISNMDKNAYETYEFLPANGSESEHDQFFVVQDDGTFLLNRQVQYVAQVQDVKEALEDVQPCTVYGVSSQQFFVDVDNSAELISVADQFIIPDGDNSLYTNSYLLQPSSSNTTTDQMEEDVVVDQYKPPNTQDVDIDVVTHNSKQGNNFTEITLSDEQYHTLEQKGWILLESNDKIFVLNTLGLHDITTNDKLIQRLKNEIQNDNNIAGNDGGTLKIESVSSQFPNMVTEPLVNHQETELEFVINAENQQNDDIKCVQLYVNDNKETIQQLASNTIEHKINREKLEPPLAIVEAESLEQSKQEMYYDNDTHSIKIKTKFNFKDFPDKISLGKCANGKRLVAKVVKRQPNINKVTKTKNKVNEDAALKQTAVNEDNSTTTTGLHEVDFVNLIQAMLRFGPRYNDGDIASANTVINQLLSVPNLKQSFFGQNLIVTKATNDKDEFGTISSRNKVTLLTGRVTEKDGEFCFEHIPNLLHTIKLNAEEQNVSQSDEVFSCIEEKEAKENFTIYHVHICETKSPDDVVRVSVTLNKRQLPVNLVFDLKRRYPSTVFGCSGCAILFKSEEALKEHQESKCMDTDENMIKMEASTDQSNNDDDVIVMKTGKETIFSCAQCNVTFTKLSNIQRHMKTHQGTIQEILQTTRVTGQETQPQKPPSKIYKCKMCPSTYFHSATLSKHIVTRHIKVKSN